MTLGQNFSDKNRSRASGLHRTLLSGLLASALGCSAHNPDVRVMRLPNGTLQVEGPLIGPFKTTEELAAAGCERMTRQPGADSSHGKLGKEYCALHYYSEEDHAYYLSYLSDIGGDGPDGTKYCIVPQSINELSQKKPLITGPAHTHPHNRQLSAKDMGATRPESWSPLGPAKFAQPGTGQVWERELYAFFRDFNETCFAYRYNYASRIVSALREGKWVPIGKAEGDWGAFKPLEGKDWRP